MALKDGTTSKNMLSRGLTSLLVKTKRLQLLGLLLLLLLLLRAWELHSKVLAGGCETAKHHGPEGRNDLQKHAVPGLDVPSGFWQRLQLLGLLLLVVLLELVPHVPF